MADIAAVWNFQDFGITWRDEPERMAADVHIGYGLFDLRHMASRTLVAGTSGPMMSVRLDRR